MASSVTVNVNGNVKPLQNALQDVLLDFQEALNSLMPGLSSNSIASKSASGGIKLFSDLIKYTDRHNRDVDRKELENLRTRNQAELSTIRTNNLIRKENLRQEHRMQMELFHDLGSAVSAFSGSFVNTAAAVKIIGMGFEKLKSSNVVPALKNLGKSAMVRGGSFLDSISNNSMTFGSANNIKELVHPFSKISNEFKNLALAIRLIGSTKVIPSLSNMFNNIKNTPSNILGSITSMKNNASTLFSDLKQAHFLRKNFGGKHPNSPQISAWATANGMSFSTRAKQFASHGILAGLFGGKNGKIQGLKGLLSGGIGKVLGLGSKISGVLKGPQGAVIKGAGMALLGAPLMAMFKVGKKVSGYFINIAKSAETVQKLAELIALPFKLIFTLGAIPMLVAFIPILKEMLSWITNNQETIQAIGDALARIFQSVVTPETIGIVTKLLDGFAEVIAFLGMKLEENFKTVNMNSVASFIATTITALVGFVQDCLIGLVQWMYTAEGQAFIISIAEGIGKLLGTLVVLIIAMIPTFMEIIVITLVGIFEGIVTTLAKMLASFVDIIDQATGGALTGLVNGIISMVNWFIDRINSVASVFSAINGGWQLDHVASWDSGSVGTNFSNAATNMSNTMTISNMYSIINNNSLTSNDAIKSLLSTGGY